MVGGGPCACNPEPIADFFDILFLGDGEEVDLEVIELFRKCRKEGKTKQEFLMEAAQIEGVYVPSLYDVEYNEDGTVKAYIPHAGVPKTIRKRVCNDVDNMYFPENFVVPFLDIVHDRADRRSAARVHSRLPLLPGRLPLSPVPRKERGNHQPAGKAVVSKRPATMKSPFPRSAPAITADFSSCSTRC